MNKKIKITLRWMLIPILFMMSVAYYKVENIDKGINLTQTFKTKPAFKSVAAGGIRVYPGGQPIGIRLNTKGVLVVALSDIQTSRGKVTSPAALAGIRIGDNIIKVNDCLVKNAEQTQAEINRTKGKDIKIVVERNGNEIEKIVKAVNGLEDNNYRIGLWIRDSTAGIGTLTFYDEKSGMFAALGHPIVDIDTGTKLNINSGDIVDSSIVSVKKGIKGNPGELKGIFVNEELKLGEISKNTECGIFGKGNAELKNKGCKPLKVGLRNEIKEGPAKILTTISGETPEYYDIEIEKLLVQDLPGPKSMVIKVTDSRLLDKTGGIVQGMSGSPIIQNNKLVGAVTHVLINRPEVGYGIYIDWMLTDANILSR
ncbi:SpoIVB peptidase [Clostridium sp. JNZ X4-2]